MKCPKCKNTAVKGLDIVRVPKSGVICIVPNLKKYFVLFVEQNFINGLVKNKINDEIGIKKWMLGN